MNTKLLIGAALAVAANSLQCGISDYDIYLPAFAQAFATDTSTDTDCYSATESLVSQIETLSTDISNFSTATYLDPIY